MNSVDNFVDITTLKAPKPLISRLWLDCLQKKHVIKFVINQRLAIAMGFVAMEYPKITALRTATKILCISHLCGRQIGSKKC
jgi:hypothetical protein